MRRLLPILIPLAVLGGLYGYVLWRLLGPFGAPAAFAGALSLGLAGLHIGGFALRFAGKSGSAADRIAALSYVVLSWGAVIFVLSLLRDVGAVVALGLDAAVGGWLPEGPARLLLWQQVNLGLVATSVLATLAGLVEARRTPRVKRVDVPIENLPEPFHGFTIAQLSDVHVGPTIKRAFIERVVEATSALQADAIAITGDLVDGSVEELASHVAPLSKLAALDGVFFVTGNHEYYSGAVAWVEHIKTLGIDVLLNEHRVVRREGEALTLAGVTDYSAGGIVPEHASDPARALSGAPEGTRVLLAHQPRTAMQIEGLGVDLMLAGHTHGGQFWPWHLFVKLQQPVIDGLERLSGAWVYTSRGTGYWGPPNRLGAPSEISLLRLLPA